MCCHMSPSCCRRLFLVKKFVVFFWHDARVSYLVAVVDYRLSFSPDDHMHAYISGRINFECSNQHFFFELLFKRESKFRRINDSGRSAVIIDISKTLM